MQMILTSPFLAFGAAGLMLNQVHAEAISVAGVTLNIEPPSGYCALDERSGDRAFFLTQRELLRPKNELIQASVPCDQLKAVVAGKLESYSRWAQVQVINVGPKLHSLSISRSDFIKGVAKSMQRRPIDVAVINRQMTEKLTGKGLSVTASKIEVVGSDDNAAYVSMSGRLESSGVSSVIVMFGSMTLVKQLPVGVYGYEKQGAPPGELPTVVVERYLRSILVKN
jgi:hypothetical protein